MKRGRVATDQGQRCGNCRHYKDETEAGDTEAHGECRRFPRTWVADVLTFKDGRLLAPELVRKWDEERVEFRGHLLCADTGKVL